MEFTNEQLETIETALIVYADMLVEAKLTTQKEIENIYQAEEEHTEEGTEDIKNKTEQINSFDLDIAKCNDLLNYINGRDA